MYICTVQYNTYKTTQIVSHGNFERWYLTIFVWGGSKKRREGGGGTYESGGLDHREGCVHIYISVQFAG